MADIFDNIDIFDEVAAAKPKTQPFNPNQTVDGVPKWGRDNPNLYAGVMTGLDILPTVAGFAKSSLVGIPLAGAINAGAKYAQRQISDMPTTQGDVAKDFGVGMLGEGGGRAISSILGAVTNVPKIQEGLQNTGKKLYQSAMKFSTSPNVLTPAERNAITETGLKYNLMPNDTSYLRLKNMVGANTDKVDNLIAQGTAQGDTIPAQEILDRAGITDLLKYGEDVKSVAPGYKAAVSKQAKNMLDEVLLSPSAANASKKQIYKELESAYGDNTLHTPSIETKKQIARGIKASLENLYPEIGKLNANSSELLALSDHLARSMGRIGNRDVIGLGDKIVLDMITGKVANPVTAATGIISLIDRPQIKARLAQVLYKANTGKDLPIGQWKKGLKYIGDVAAPAARAAFEGALYTTNDPLGIR